MEPRAPLSVARDLTVSRDPGPERARPATTNGDGSHARMVQRIRPPPHPALQFGLRQRRNRRAELVIHPARRVEQTPAGWGGERPGPAPRARAAPQWPGFSPRSSHHRDGPPPKTVARANAPAGAPNPPPPTPP